MRGKAVLNIHGGGFVVGTARDRTALLTAAELGATVYGSVSMRSGSRRWRSDMLALAGTRCSPRRTNESRMSSAI
jgi:hypothetical protein